MIVVGITGSSGSGKGYISGILGNHGFPCLDTDEVCHELYMPGTACTAEMSGRIGSEILASDGSVDRGKLRALAFSSDEVYRLMNDIAHRHIKSYTLGWLGDMNDEGQTAAVIDAPLLFESGFDALCDVTVAVTCDSATRISRIVSRDGISREEAERRLGMQKPDAWYVMQADYVIDNSAGTENSLAARTEEFCSIIDDMARLNIKLRRRRFHR